MQLQQAHNESALLAQAQAQAQVQMQANVEATPARHKRKDARTGKGKGKGVGKKVGRADTKSGRGKTPFSQLTPEDDDVSDASTKPDEKKSRKPNKTKNKRKTDAKSSGPSTQDLIQSEVAVQLAKQNGTSTSMGDGAVTEIKKTKLSDLYFGAYNSILKDDDARKQFSNSIRSTAKNPSLICKDDKDFKLDTDLDANIQPRHMFLLLDAKWFEDDIKKASTDKSLSETAAKFVAFSTIHDKIDAMVTKIIDHYKPVGAVFLLISSFEIVDAMIASYAAVNGHVIIQFNATGSITLQDVEPEKLPGIFGFRISRAAGPYLSYKKKDDTDKATKANTVYKL